MRLSSLCMIYYRSTNTRNYQIRASESEATVKARLTKVFEAVDLATVAGLGELTGSTGTMGFGGMGGLVGVAKSLKPKYL